MTRTTQTQHHHLRTGEYDLVIVGGGIVGTTLAVALKDIGLKICLVETQSRQQATEKKQAYALSILSGKIFTGIGVWQDIFPNIGKFKYIRLSDDFSPQVVKFYRQELNTDYLGYVGEHCYILSALHQATDTSNNITWLENATVTQVNRETELITVKIKQLDQEISLTTKLIVGADGAKSLIRQQAGIKTRGWKYWQSCIAFTVQHSAESNNIAFERFWQTGPMGILPLPGNRCQIVWSNPHHLAQELQSLSSAEFIERLEYQTEGLLGKLELISDRILFPVKLMQSETYVQPRLALVGDAAHCCHPVGGQGLNLGIKDAAALAEILIEAYQQGRDIGDIAVLKRYENWRQKENLIILSFTDFLTRFFSNNIFPLVALRRMGLWLMRQIKPLKIFSLRLMTGLKGRKPKLAG
jgi:2-octaprenyl-6-methoxyphenol hydroxylase